MVRVRSPELFVFRSTEIWHAISEFERSSTAVLHGYVNPRVSLYLERLEAALAAPGVPARPLITRANGG